MSDFWQKLSGLGISERDSLNDIRNISLANRISFVMLVLNNIILAYVLVYFGYVKSVPYIAGSNLLYFLVLTLNWKGFHIPGRLLLSIAVPVMALAISVIIKEPQPDFENYTFYELRIIIFTSAILPLLIFSLKDWLYLSSALLINLCCLMLYDPIHNFFGVGYYQMGLTDRHYYYMNFIFLVCHIFLVIPIIFLKKITSSYESSNLLLMEELNIKNEELRSQNENLNNLNIEIAQNLDEIRAQSEKISMANQTIERQKKELSLKNQQLEGVVEEKSRSLVKSNAELKSRNEELKQFSYALSHNLRGPVASLLGLTDLFRKSQDEENRDILEHISKSAKSLDLIIRGMSKVLELNDQSEIEAKREINLNEEVRTIEELLHREIKTSHAEIETDFGEVSIIKTIKPYLNSILYNLVSNSVKYRTPERKPRINLKTTRFDKFIGLEIRDNGIGIDLKKYRSDLFKMYKRFHSHVPGNGLGLYLVKLQVERLGGRVEVESEVDKGTSFKIFLPLE